jgi:hypothetical protein
MHFLKALHDFLYSVLIIERIIDPFFRPAFDAVLQERLAELVQFLIKLRRPREALQLSEESRHC